MANIISVRVMTAEKVNPEAGEDKYWRAYDIPGHGVLTQWGSQRNGRSGGQFKLSTSGDASEQFRKKIRSGYIAQADYAFRIDGDKIVSVTDARILGIALDNIRASTADGQDDNPLSSNGQRLGTTVEWRSASAALDYGNTPTPANFTQPATDVLTQLTNRVQAAISTAVDDPAAAMAEFSELADLVTESEEQTIKLRSFYDTLQMLLVGAVTGK